MNGAEILRQAAYEEGYKAGITATNNALRAEVLRYGRLLLLELGA